MTVSVSRGSPATTSKQGLDNDQVGCGIYASCAPHRGRSSGHLFSFPYSPTYPPVTRSVVNEPAAHITVRLCQAITAIRFGYCENSVTVGLSACRRSHVPLRRNVLARLRCPIHVLQCTHCASPIGQGVAWKKVDSMHTDGVGSTDVLPTSVSTTAGHWDSGNQLSPYRAGVAGTCHTRLLTSPAFPSCSCPLSFQNQVRRVASKS
jgi:hypothetical protein